VEGSEIVRDLLTLNRGESVSVYDIRGNYVRVRISDGTEGFVREATVLRATEIATVVAETKTFKRPSLVNLAKRLVAPGTPLFVIGAKGDFAEVNYSGSATTWVLRENLNRDPASVALARIINRVRALADDKKADRTEEIEGLVKLGTSSYPKSPLLPELVRVLDPEEADALAAALANVKAELKRVTFDLHGSTPTLAWSPDSKRLLVNTAYEYFGHEASLARYKNELGVYVVDADTGEGSHVYRGTALHPIWLADDQIAWGSSTYEANEDAGLYVARLEDGVATPRRVAGVEKGVHHVAPGVSGGALFVEVDWSKPAEWKRYDPSADETFVVARANDTWVPPAKHVDSQCRTELGGRVAIGDGEGIRIKDSDGSLVPVSDEAPYRYNVGDWVCDGPNQGVQSGQCAYTPACFSPDGNRLAVLHGSVDELRLAVYEL
ncbi:MAG: hypothetical protein AAFX94_16960, partial [Myxococcota bacterium]